MELVNVSRYSPLSLFFLFFFSLFSLLSPVRSTDAEALLSLKSSIDPLNSLPWQKNQDVCNWKGIKECLNGRVSKLVLEYLNLTGTLDERSINQLDQLRVLSFKGNALSGPVPTLSGLVNLKSLYLNENKLSGGFPESLSGLHRLKVIVLAGNQISGDIPLSLLKLRRLYILYLEDNQLTGTIPPLNQTSLRFFNVSNNKLSGKIPATPALVRFNTSSFLGNIDLCGEQIQNPCSNTNLGPAPSPDSKRSSKSSSSSKRAKLIKIVAGSVGGLVVVVLLLTGVVLVCLVRKKSEKGKESTETRSKGIDVGGEAAERGEGSGVSGMGGNNGGKQGGFSWEGEGLGSLVFLGAGDQQMSYSLEDLLKASAETLGRGTMGSTYKAVMESGFIVTVKRLKDARYPRLEEFGRQMDVLGRLRHPNVVPLRAYFQAKEERLLVYDYFPNGSLFSLIHGTHSPSFSPVNYYYITFPI